MRITTVIETNSSDFDSKINELLRHGWELHGTPTAQTVAQQDTWDGRLRCWKETTYSQVLKINN